jgi:hypothetical protein
LPNGWRVERRAEFLESLRIEDERRRAAGALLRVAEDTGAEAMHDVHLTPRGHSPASRPARTPNARYDVDRSRIVRAAAVGERKRDVPDVPEMDVRRCQRIGLVGQVSHLRVAA